MTREQTHIIVLDDHEMAGRGVAALLKDHDSNAMVTAVTDISTFRSALKDSHASLCIIDYWIAGEPADQILAELIEDFPSLPVLIISGDIEPLIVKRVKQLGAHGFVLKGCSTDELWQACLALIDGKSWFSNIPAGVVSQRHLMLHITPQELGLTVRQGKILQLMLQGLPNKRIALDLGLTENTVKEHVGNILGRLSLPTRAAVLSYFHERKMVLNVEN